MKMSPDGGPVTVATGQNDPDGIVIDATSVYWCNAAGTVMKEPLDGGAPVTIASGQDGPDNVAVDATSVYWTTSSAVDEGHSEVTRRRPRGAGVPTWPAFPRPTLRRCSSRPASTRCSTRHWGFRAAAAQVTCTRRPAGRLRARATSTMSLERPAIDPHEVPPRSTSMAHSGRSRRAASPASSVTRESPATAASSADLRRRAAPGDPVRKPRPPRYTVTCSTTSSASA